MKRWICWGLSVLLTAGIVVFVVTYFCRDLVIRTGDWFFENPEGVRNLIYLFTALVGAYLLYWRTKIAGREANTSEKNVKIAELTLNVAEQTAKATEQNTKTAKENITDQRISLATEQLDNKNPSTRLNGIFSLEKIAKDSEEEREKIMQILSTRIRELAPRDIKKENQMSWGTLASKNTQALFPYLWIPFIERQKQHEDIENIIKALSNIRRMYPNERLIVCNLHGTDLSGVSLFGFNLVNFNILNSNLTSANLGSVNLTGAYISSSNLNGANFSFANLTNVIFKWSNFEDTRLNGADVSNADFEGVTQLTSEQIKEAFYREGEPPSNLPDGLDLPRMKAKEELLRPPPPLP